MRRENQLQHPTEDRVVTRTAWEVGGKEANLKLNYSFASQSLRSGGWAGEDMEHKGKDREAKLNREMAKDGETSSTSPASLHGTPSSWASEPAGPADKHHSSTTPLRPAWTSQEVQTEPGPKVAHTCFRHSFRCMCVPIHVCICGCTQACMHILPSILASL